MIPKMIGGSDDGERKPGLLVTISSTKKPSGMPKQIGGDEDEPEQEGESVSNDQAMDDAAGMLITELGKVNPKMERVRDALKAFFYACDASPHEEGEHTDEEGSE